MSRSPRHGTTNQPRAEPVVIRLLIVAGVNIASRLVRDDSFVVFRAASHFARSAAVVMMPTSPRPCGVGEMHATSSLPRQSNGIPMRDAAKRRIRR